MARDSETQPNEFVDPFPTYKTKSDYPSGTPAATVYFSGLLCVFFNGDEECTVAVNKAPSHILQLGIWKKGRCDKIGFEFKESFQEIKINVTDPVEKGVFVYAPPTGSTATSDRHRYSYVEYSLDMESPRLHNSLLIKKTENLWPRFYLNNGLFSAYKLSESRFAMQRAKEVQQIGAIGLALAADIFVNDGGSIEFIVDNTTPLLSLPWTIGDEYEIAITNSCTGKVFDPRSRDPKLRNDFHHYYEVLDVLPAHQFQLVNVDVHGESGPIKLGECVVRDDHPVSDPSPCQHLGFGKTPNLTDSAPTQT